MILSDNSLIITNTRYFNKRRSFFITKYDFFGKKLFKKQYHVENGLSDFDINSIIESDNQSFMVVGNEYSRGYRIWLRIFDRNGVQLFKKTYQFSKSALPGSIIRLVDNNYVITGTYNSEDIIHLKIDNQGNQIWKKIIKSNQSESFCFSGNMNSQKFFTVCGQGELGKFGTGKSHVKIAKFDPEGVEIKRITMPGRFTGQTGSIACDSHHSALYVSYDSPVIPRGNPCVSSNLNENTMYLSKLNRDLDILWNVSLGKKMPLIFPPLIHCIDGHVVLAGKGNVRRCRVEPSWICVMDTHGRKHAELRLERHLDFSPDAMVAQGRDIFLVGTEMDIHAGRNSRMVIFKVGYGDTAR